ncbi:multicopper oxidase family protein [Rhodothermus marinus]|uniref:multicopper oxidase family protein n=1 Tax=Rhodothermus marinus TaxID=29549 RepID=UPI0037C7B546
MPDRRSFLRALLGTTAALAVPGLWTAGCRREPADAATIAPSLRQSTPTGPARTVRLRAEEIEVEVAPGRVYRTWGYNGAFPGPELRVREGEQLQIVVENHLPEPTTIHWHGVPVPNAMDGVPGLTQDPIAPGETFTYTFVAAPSGSYLYHSHVGLQLDRGLLGALIIEETTPHVSYDREYTLVLDDLLPGEPRPLTAATPGMRGRGMMGRGMMGGMMGVQVPSYAGSLINGRLPEAAPVFEVRRGERVRLRLLNPSGASTFRFAIDGHALLVTHADGRPVEPVRVDNLLIGMGERYDVVIEADNPGRWAIVAVPVEGTHPPARAVLHYRESRARGLPSGLPETLRGRPLDYSDLRCLEMLPAQRPDRSFDLLLSGGMMMNPRWTINGQAYPDAEPLEIARGERVRFRMVNHSMMLHPMHLHGHFFRVGDALKDTVLVPPHMGRVVFDFVADNPGRWFFHCHNLYHLESGMAREVRYRA